MNALSPSLLASTTLASAAFPAGPDAELVAMGREAAPLIEDWVRNVRAFVALPVGSPELAQVSALNDAPHARLEALVDAAADLPARTVAGAAAKARLLRWLLATQHGDGMDVWDCADPEAAFAATLADDLIGMAPAADADAELFAAFSRYQALQGEANARCDGCRSLEDERRERPIIKSLEEQAQPYFDLICAIPARTVAGLAAKARALELTSTSLIGDPEDKGQFEDKRMVGSLVRDALALSDLAGPFAPRGDLDTELLAMAAELWTELRRNDEEDDADDRAGRSWRWTRKRQAAARRFHKLRGKIARARAHTPAGRRAKAELVQRFSNFSYEHLGTRRETTALWQDDDAMAWSLARDVLEADQAQPAAAASDAALIADCEAWLRMKEEFERYYDTLPGDMPKDDPGWSILDPQEGLEERIIAARATTAEGQLARLRCAAFTWLPGADYFRDDPDLAFENRVHRAALRDVKGVAL